jgi:NTP pyrophosphatase (non-canonical NTP hydrolase)
MATVLSVHRRLLELGAAIGVVSSAIPTADPECIQGKITNLTNIACSIADEFGFPMAEVINAKMALNRRKYNAELCRESARVDKYTIYSEKTGVYKDADVPVLPGEATRGNSFATLSKLQDAFAAEVCAFASERNWLHHYNTESVMLSLYSEFGELSSTLQWENQTTTINSMHHDKRDAIARELADIIIYVFHLTRLLSSDTRSIKPFVI